MKKTSARRQAAMESLVSLERKRRKDIAKCALSLLAILALVFGRTALEVAGVISADNSFASGLMMMAALGLCIFAGTASLDATKCRNARNAILNSHRIDEKQLAELRKSR